MTTLARAYLLAALAFASTACAGTAADQARLARAEAEVSRDESQIEDTEIVAQRLSASWQRVRAAYDSSRETFELVDRRYREAARVGATAGSTFQRATQEWQEAAWRWRVYQELIQVAAALDAANPEQARRHGLQESDLSCKTTSTAAFRRMLEAQGVDLAGKDIDHIVPHSLGGPDNIANYQVLSSSVNRSIGNMWGPEKCRMAGDRCAVAIAVTSKCSPGFGGWLP